MSNPVEKRGAIIPLGWPEMTARGSERIWDYLRKLGIIKNVNLLVGHAGMIVVQHDQLEYFDFGRYITPKTMGRARSSRTDPKLRLKTIPEWDNDGKLLNLVGILQELENNSEATHGEGPIYATVYYDADIEKVLEYAYSIQDLGFLGYNGLDRKCTNCARFVARGILAGLTRNSMEYLRFRYPLSYAPTPYSNVLTASKGNYCVFHQGQANFQRRPRQHALTHILGNLTHAFRRSKATKLPSDRKAGQLYPPKPRPKSVPKKAIYIGGIGEGAWHDLESVNAEIIKMTRYNASGEFEFSDNYELREPWISKFNSGQCELVHDTHFAWLTLESKSSGERIRCFRKIL